MEDIVLEFLDRRKAEQQASELVAPPAFTFPKRVPAPVSPRPEKKSLRAMRERLQRGISDFLEDNSPGFLLVPAPPGTGKTYAGARAAENYPGRVLYAGPRRDFFGDLVDLAIEPDNYYAWKPRDEETCQFPRDISDWLARGYRAMDYCVQICGWDYINNECIYHSQKKRKEKIIYGNHLHLVLGHPLMSEFDLIIGDECPLGTIVHDWRISANHILLDIDPEEPIAEIIYTLARAAESKPKRPLSGMRLISALAGGSSPELLGELKTVLVNYLERFSEEAIIPTLNYHSSARKVPSYYLPELLPLLIREVEYLESGNKKYPHRIYVGNGELRILLRRNIVPTAPNKIIWFDATGTKELYEAMFQRPVQVLEMDSAITGTIIQVVSRTNSKSSLSDENKVDQLRSQVQLLQDRHKNGRVAVIGHKDLLLENSSHFYAQRGSNHFENVAAVVVAGTPGIRPGDIENTAKCLWFNSMEPFNMDWQRVLRRYRGQPWAYPVGQFADARLNAVLWQYREAEIIQAAHRGRILYRDIPVYLLTNIPIEQLPPDELLEIYELYDAPRGVNVFKWAEFMRAVEMVELANGAFTLNEIVECGIPKRTAQRYIKIAMAHGYIEQVFRRTIAGRGKPKQFARSLSNDNYINANIDK